MGLLYYVSNIMGLLQKETLDQQPYRMSCRELQFCFLSRQGSWLGLVIVIRSCYALLTL